MGPDLPQQEHLPRLFLRGSMVTLISFLGLSVISTVRKRKPLIGHDLLSRFLTVLASGMVVFFDHLTYQIRSSSQMFIFPQWCFLPTDFEEEAKIILTGLTENSVSHLTIVGKRLSKLYHLTPPFPPDSTLLSQPVFRAFRFTTLKPSFCHAP